MSPDHLPHDTLDQIYDEIIEHMKISGVFDDVRVNLMDPIWSDPKFKDVIAKFESECERFCEGVDLDQNRNSLRAKLATKIDGYSTTGRLLKSHIERLLKERNDEIKSRYYKHANDFLQKFLPEYKPKEEPSPEPKQEPAQEPIPQEEQKPTQNLTQDVKPESIDDSTRQGKSADVEYQDVDMDVDMDIDSTPEELVGEGWQDDEEDIERPVYSPIGAIKEEPDQDGRTELREKEQEHPREEVQNVEQLEEGDSNEREQEVIEEEQLKIKEEPKELQEIEEIKQEELLIPIPPEDDDNQNSDDDIDKLTFSPVSSVDTADLSDFDNSIKLSDDEATIVGKPKNSKVPIQVIQGSIIDLQTSKPSSGRRVTRTRKSNPKYDNKDFKLL